MNPPSLIQHQHSTRFNRDGVVRIDKVLSSNCAQRLLSAFQKHIGSNPEINAYGVLRNNIWKKVPAFEEVLRNSDLARIAMDLLHVDSVICFQDNVICKLPGSSDNVEWHQDFSYWPLDQPLGITLWVSLTEADPENGCMSFVPGSHSLGERCPTNFVPNSNQPLRDDLPALQLSDAPNPPVPFATEIGDVIAHHPFSWHMSPGNHSERWRCAWSITFLSTAVRWDPGHAPHPFNLSESPNKGDSVVGPLFPNFRRGLH